MADRRHPIRKRTKLLANNASGTPAGAAEKVQTSHLLTGLLVVEMIVMEKKLLRILAETDEPCSDT